MSHSTDQQLLRDYTDRQLEPAFAELVRRHIDFVYAAALRIVRDSHLAEDVTQAVFVALAQNSRQLRERTPLEGWLHGTTRNLAANAVRTDVRRRAREQEAVTMTELLSANPDANWEHIAPHLDAALGELSEPDRDALLLRYFKNHDLRTVGTTLGISDDAAQKRVSRAVDRLRAFLAKRGITVGASGLAVVISANAVQAAPAALALTITTAAALTGTTLATTATITATKAIAMTAIQKILVAATIAALAGVGIYEGRQVSQLREQNLTLQQQQAPLTDQIQQLQRRVDETESLLAGLREDNARLNRNSGELLKLRGEAARARSQIDEQASDPTATAAKSWLERVNKLKQRFENDPRQGIPELRFLNENDWLNAAMNRLETETDFRRALGSIRSIASGKAAEGLLRGIKKFIKDNNGQFPSDAFQLTSYLPETFDSSVLSRWEVRPASEFKHHGLKGDWLMVEKNAIDEAYDWQWVVSSEQSNSIPFGERGQIDKASIAFILEPVRQAFAAANAGRDPKNPLEALPYATTPEQQETLQTMIRLYQQQTQPATNQSPQR